MSERKALKRETTYTRVLYGKEHGTFQENEGKMRLKRYSGRGSCTILQLTSTMLQVFVFFLTKQDSVPFKQSWMGRFCHDCFCLLALASLVFVGFIFRLFRVAFVANNL